MPGQLTCASCGSLNPAGSQFCATCDAYLLEGQPPARSPAEVLRDRQQPAGHRADEPRERPTEEVPALREPPRASGTSGRDDARSTSLPPIPLPADLQRCPTCGTANELTRTFCSRCGTRLIHGTVVPTTSAPTERSVNTRYVAVGAGLGIVLLVLFALIFGPRGPEVPGTDPTATPTLIADATTPLATTAATTDPPVTDPPASSPTASPTAQSGCETQTVTAPAPIAWRILRGAGDLTVDATSRPAILSFRAYRRQGGDNTASVHAELVRRDEVRQRFGVDPPPEGDHALVIAFSGDVRMGTSRSRAFPNLKAGPVAGAIVAERQAGDTVAAVGIVGTRCFTMTWDNGSDPTVLRLLIE